MLKYWIALVGAVVISSCSQVLLKKGAASNHGSFLREYLNFYVIAGYGLMVLSTLCTIFAYRGVAYKNGAVIESLGYLLIMFLGRIVFGEKITLRKVIGNLIILAGVVVFYL